MRTFITLLSLFVVSTMTGCFPMRYAANPGVRGMVVDERTRAPIRGAEVFRSTATYSFYVFTNQTTEGITEEMKTAPSPKPPPVDAALGAAYAPTVQTDPAGQFIITPTKKWMLYIVPMDIGWAHGTLVIRAVGYRPELRHVATRSIADVGVVALTKSE